jgi:hypothetical protein
MRPLAVGAGMNELDPTEPVDAPVSVGQAIFDDEGEQLGVIRELLNGGFAVSVDLGAGESQRSTSGEFGEAYLMWRCLECGEMGDIDSLPDECPNCHAERESLYYWTED